MIGLDEEQEATFAEGSLEVPVTEDQNETPGNSLSGGQIPEQRVIPKIKSEVDTPFPIEGTKQSNQASVDANLAQTDDLDKEITKFKFRTGRKVLYIAMIAMGVAVLCDIIVSGIPNVESNLIDSAFEAFKLITMTVLGYIFGSNNTK